MRDFELLRMQKQLDVHNGIMETVIVPGVAAVTHNEALTRARVNNLDARVDQLELWQLSSFWQRLMWICRGSGVVLAPPVVQTESTDAKTEADTGNGPDAGVSGPRLVALADGGDGGRPAA
jgi:hypothetical protein